MKKPESFWGAASRILSDRVCTFSRLCRKAATRASADNIHDVRVSSRRLAAALDVFDLDELAGLKKDAARIRKKIGKIRDLDIAIGNIRDFSETLDAGDRQECENIAAKLHRKRQRWLCQVRPLLRCSIPMPHLVLLEEESAAFGDEAPVHLRPLLAAASELLDRITSTDNARPLHLLRICVKRLRYKIEIFASSIELEVDGWLTSCKELQDRLGEVHDLDILIELIEEEWKEGLQGGPCRGGIERLLQEAWRKRHRLSSGLLASLSEEAAFLERIRSSLF